MMFLSVNSSKGQVKIQQMAFVLVALVLLFTLVGLFAVTLASSSLRDQAESLREKEALEQVRRIASTPEFAFTAGGDCVACIDTDKLLALKEKQTYKGFWELPFIQIRQVYPKETGECTPANYPNCETITLANQTSNIISPQGAFVALCRFDSGKEGYSCELGKVLVGFKTT